VTRLEVHGAGLFIGLAFLAIGSVIAATPAATPVIPLGVPMFAKVYGDGKVVNFAWWSVRGATEYQLLRAPDPQASAATVAEVPTGTLGATDPQPEGTGMYYQLVAVGAGGARAASAWTLVNTPTVTGVTANGAGATVSWSTVQPSAGGFEVWRTADPAKPPSRIGSVPSGTTTFIDRQLTGASNYYQVVALGAGGTRAASPLYAFAAGTGTALPAIAKLATSAAVAVPNGAGTAPPPPPAPPGPPGAPGSIPTSPTVSASLASVPTLANKRPALGSASTSPAPAVSLPGGAPGAGVSALPAAPASAPPPGATPLLPSAPAITGLTVLSSTPAAHVVQWDCIKDEWQCGTSSTIYAAGTTPNIPIFQYEISSKAPDATQFDPVTPSSPIAAYSECANTACTQTATHIKANLKAYVAPNTTFEVVRIDTKGKLTRSLADFVYASPPQPQEPGSFTATETQPGQVLLSWTAVPNAVRYLVTIKGSTSTAPPPNVPQSQSTIVFRNQTPGLNTYQIASDYGVPVPSVALPEASVLVHNPPPAHSGAFLTKNNGAGSAAAEKKHFDLLQVGCVICLTVDRSLKDVAEDQSINLASGQDGTEQFRGPLVKAFYANVTELGLGHSVGCWQWSAGRYDINSGINTNCLAGSHGTPGGPQLPDGPALAASAYSATGSSYGLIVDGWFVVNFVGPGVDPLYMPATDNWGKDWQVSPTTILDSEGPKYTPHACLACHGGTYDANSGKLKPGASFLPIDPGLVVFGSQAPYDRASQEESIRALNAMIATSKHVAPAVADYINGLYNGQVSTPGTIAQSNYVPAAWSQQAQLFLNVVKPDCLMCHLATPAALNFGTADNFINNKAAIYADVCVAHVMPNAEVPYHRLWMSAVNVNGTLVDAVAYMMGILGYNSCP